MSWRTIIEINHDHLHDLPDMTMLDKLRRDLGSCQVIVGSGYGQYGHLRVLAQRHHADEITVKVK